MDIYWGISFLIYETVKQIIVKLSTEIQKNPIHNFLNFNFLTDTLNI